MDAMSVVQVWDLCWDLEVFRSFDVWCMWWHSFWMVSCIWAYGVWCTSALFIATVDNHLNCLWSLGVWFYFSLHYWSLAHCTAVTLFVGSFGEFLYRDGGCYMFALDIGAWKCNVTIYWLLLIIFISGWSCIGLSVVYCVSVKIFLGSFLHMRLRDSWGDDYCIEVPEAIYEDLLDFGFHEHCWSVHCVDVAFFPGSLGVMFEKLGFDWDGDRI